MGNLIYWVTVYTYMVHTIRSEHLFYLKAILKKSENEKGKTDVQGAENRQLKQIDMAQMSNCDKIKVRLKTRGDRKKAGKPSPHWLTH